MSRLHTLTIVLWIGFAASAGLDHIQRGGDAPSESYASLSGLRRDLFGSGWTVEDIAVSDETLDVAKVSDHAFLRFRREAAEVFLYIGLVGSGTSQGIHHPAVCFPAQGIRIEEARIVEIDVPGEETPWRFNEYLGRKDPDVQVYALSTFFFGKKPETGVWSLRWKQAWSNQKAFAIITVFGMLGGPVGETRALYRDLVREAAPEWLRLLP
ncbi:MAG: exosortase-associated EpsI family protein [Planctomycetes bacterium]|nr:exosortase-associated EpsI family protein [Planctomycetota bacterium]